MCRRSASHSSCGRVPEDLTIRRPGQQKTWLVEEIGTAALHCTMCDEPARMMQGLS